MSWSCSHQTGLPGLALPCTAVPGCSSLSAECLGHFGLWRPREHGRRYRAELAPCLQCHPSVMGHIQGWQCPLTTPFARAILFAAPSASPLHAVTTWLPSRTTGQPPKAATLMAVLAASGVRGSHPGPRRAAVVGACVGCKELLRPGVGAECGQSILSSRRVTSTVKQECN